MAFVWAMYKKGLGTINKEKTREIELFARIEILVRQQSLRKPKVFSLQILRRYLTKEGRVRKFSAI